MYGVHEQKKPSQQTPTSPAPVATDVVVQAGSCADGVPSWHMHPEVFVVHVTCAPPAPAALPPEPLAPAAPLPAEPPRPPEATLPAEPPRPALPPEPPAPGVPEPEPQALASS